MHPGVVKGANMTKTIVTLTVILIVGASFAVQTEFVSRISAVQSVAPGAKTSATVTGTAVDLRGYGSATVLVTAGAHTDGTHSITIQDSTASNAGFSTVAADKILGSTVTIDDATSASRAYAFGYLGEKRFLRVYGTIANATTGAVWGATILRGDPVTLPTN